jgi:hypothetical protein
MSDRDVARTPADQLRALGHRGLAAPTEDTPRWHLAAAEEASAAGRWDEAREALDRARANLNGDLRDTSEAAFVGLRLSVARLDILAATAELTNLMNLHDHGDPVWNRRARSVIAGAPKLAGTDLLLQLLPTLAAEPERGGAERALAAPTEIPVLPGEAEWLEEVADQGHGEPPVADADALGNEVPDDLLGPTETAAEIPVPARAAPLPPVPAVNPFTAAAERARGPIADVAFGEPDVGERATQREGRGPHSSGGDGGGRQSPHSEDRGRADASLEAPEILLLDHLDAAAEAPVFTGRLLVAGTDVDLSDADGLRDRLVEAMLAGAVTDQEGDELFHTASTFLNNFDYATAEALFSAAMQVPHLRVAGCEGLVQCLVKLGRMSDAVTTAALAVRIFSDDAQALLGILYWQGVAAEAQGDRLTARKCFERIVLSRQVEHFPDVSARLERIRSWSP